MLYIDLHLVHEVTSPQAFDGIRLAGRQVRRPDLTIATADHNVPTENIDQPVEDPISAKQLEVLEANTAEFGITHYGMGDPNQGIVHVIGPEQGRTLPGMTICNMSIEAGAKAGLIAPDDVTFAYLEGRAHAPKGAAWEAALDDWRALPTDADAAFDKEVHLDAADIAPHVSWGTNPAQVVPVTERVPEPTTDTEQRALKYMALEPGTAITEIRLDRVFIGSCTNSRIGDLRAAAQVIDGRKVASSVDAMVVPGSEQVRAQAEAEGLDEVFRAAGFDWRSAGCSMCLGMNPDIAAPGERVASTSNRNFEGRQGRGARSHLVSPKMAAAAAIEGHFVDIRGWE